MRPQAGVDRLKPVPPFRQTKCVCRHPPCGNQARYRAASESARGLPRLCLAGLTLVQTLTILPAGSMRKVLRDAMPREPSEPYWSTIFLPVSESNLKGQALLGAELLVAVGGIDTDADDHGVGLLVFGQILLKVMGLRWCSLGSCPWGRSTAPPNCHAVFSD